MRNKRKYILIDTDIWVGFMLDNDPNHQRASDFLEQIRKRDDQIVISSEIVGETITVLSHKSGQGAARRFLEFAGEPDENNLVSIFNQDSFHQKALRIFYSQDKKGTSYVDCSNVAIMEEFEFDQICAFDKVYHKSFGLDNLVYPAAKAA